MQKYGVNELRRMFLEFFESKEHLAMKSFSLVPHNDNSLLLINSVMAQIRAEKDGKVLKAADSTENKTKHSKAKRLLVRYGSLAACLAIVTLVGVNVLPHIMKKSASMNETASAYSLEAEADVLISDENPAEEERSAQSNAARM